MEKKRKTVTEKVLPIKDTNTLEEVKDTLLHSFRYGRRNLTIFQVGKATLLRVSDVLNLKMNDVYDDQGFVKNNAYTKDKKTGKRNILYLKPVLHDLNEYYRYRQQNHIQSPWLFPSSTDSSKAVSPKQFYKVMAKTGELLGLDYLGTHTMRKTGAFRVYEQSGHDIALVMKLLNHSSESTTLAYLGLDQQTRENILDHIDFG